MNARKQTPQRSWYALHFQATYFLREPVQPISIDHLSLIQETFLPDSKRTPLVLPFTDEMPPQVPRAQLRSEDDAWQIEITPIRTNVHVQHIKGGDLDSMPDIGVYEKLGVLIAQVVERSKVPIVRLAGVSEFFHLPEKEPPALSLAKHFFKPDFLKAPFNRPSTLEVHSHKTYEFDGFKVNSWVRVKNAVFEVPPKGAEADAIFFQSDINTLADSTREIPLDQIRGFFALLPREVLRVRRLYFPQWEA